MPFIARFIQGEKVDLAAMGMYGSGQMELPSFAVPVHYVDEFGEANPVSKAPAGSVMLMDIIGGITKYDTWCGPSGALTKAAILKSGIDNPNISGIVLNFDTPGGESTAVELISQVIREGKATKPIIAYVHGYCASAGYWIAANCTEIIMYGNLSMVGSVGVYQRMFDYSKRFEQMGVSIQDYYSSLSPLKNEEYRAWQKKDDKPLTKTLDRLALEFQDSVKANRANITDSAAYEGRLYFTQDAVKIGMADREGTLEDAIDAAAAPPKVTSNNTYMKKIQIGAAFTGLLAFFGVKTKEGETFAEADWTEDKQKDLNAKLETVSKLETDLTAAQKSLEDEQAKTAKLEKEKAELQAKIDNLPGGKTTTAEAGKETPAAGKEDENKVVDVNAEHNQLAKQYGITVQS